MKRLYVDHSAFARDLLKTPCTEHMALFILFHLSPYLLFSWQHHTMLITVALIKWFEIKKYDAC